MDDPGRPDGSGLPRCGGEGRGAGRESRARAFERIGEIPFTSERKLMSTRARSTLEGEPRSRGLHQGRARRAARPLHRGAGRRPTCGRSPRARDARSSRPSTASATLRCGPSPSRTGRWRRDGGRRRTSRWSRSSSTSAWSGSSTRRGRRRGRDRRRARGRRARAHDHRRPSAHRGADRGRPRHRAARLARRHRRRVRGDSTTRTRAQRSCGTPRSTPASRPSTSCGSSTRSTRTGGSSR